MKRGTRIILLIFSVGGFFIVAPIIILYALGYRGDLSGLTSPIGVVLLESVPNRAEVQINGESAGRTPKAISNISREEITLNVSRPQYTTWEKTVDVVPGKTADFTSIRLFPEVPQSDVLSQNITQFSLSPNREILAAVTNENELRIFDLDGEEIIDSTLLVSQPNQLLWSPDNTMLLLQFGAAPLQLFNISSPETGTTQIENSRNIKDIAWDPRVPSQLIMLHTDGTLESYNSFTQTTEELSTNVTAYAPSNRSIFAVKRTHDLVTMDLQGNTLTTTPLPPDAQVQKLVATPAGSLAMIFESGEISLYKEGEITPLADNAISAGWDPNGQMLYIQTSQYEVIIHNVNDQRITHIEEGKSQLITRLSRPIRHLQWFAGGRHLIYQVDDEVVITEIDTRGHAISNTIDTTNTGNAMISVGQDGEALFYLKKDDDIFRLVKTPLVLEE